MLWFKANGKEAEHKPVHLNFQNCKSQKTKQYDKNFYKKGGFRKFKIVPQLKLR